MGRQYYLITSLPSLDELGSAPPMSLRGLQAHVADDAGPRAVVEVILLGDDLLQRQAVLSGELEQAEPTVLTPAQLRDDEPLPAFPPGDDSQPPPRVADDAVWAGYYRHAAGVARAQRSGFLAEWVRHEVALRNAIAEDRAKRLGLDVDEYLVARDLDPDGEDCRAAVNEWSAAPDPLAAMKALDNTRWTWLADHDRWFTFQNDELAAYAAKLVLLHRWHRLKPASHPQPSASSERTEP